MEGTLKTGRILQSLPCEKDYCEGVRRDTEEGIG